MLDRRRNLFRSAPPGRKLEPDSLSRVASAAADYTLGYFRLVPPGRRAGGAQFRPPDSFMQLTCMWIRGDSARVSAWTSSFFLEHRDKFCFRRRKLAAEGVT